MGLFSKVIGTHSEREVKRVIPIVDKIESLEPEMEKLSGRTSWQNGGV